MLCPGGILRGSVEKAVLVQCSHGQPPSGAPTAVLSLASSPVPVPPLFANGLSLACPVPGPLHSLGGLSHPFTGGSRKLRGYVHPEVTQPESRVSQGSPGSAIVACWPTGSVTQRGLVGRCGPTVGCDLFMDSPSLTYWESWPLGWGGCEWHPPE